MTDPAGTPQRAFTEQELPGLLNSITATARAIFDAQACSVFLYDEPRDELVFTAVSGQGERHLIGRRMPGHLGIAGWVVASGEPMVANDLRENAAFARELAESTGFVPDALMAAPLVHGPRVLGVLEVLDPSPQPRSGLSELDLLNLFAQQAAAALHLLVDHVCSPDTSALSSAVTAIKNQGEQTRNAATQLLDALYDALTTVGP